MIYTIGNFPDSSKYVGTDMKHFLDWLKVQDAVQVDVETNITKTRLGRRIRTIQFGEVRDDYFTFGIRFVIEWLDLMADDLAMAAVKQALQFRKVKKYIHNADFEYQCFLNYGIVMENVVDTFLQEKIKWTGYGDETDEWDNTYYSLAGCMYRYFKIILDKSYQSRFVDTEPLTEGHVVYAADDVTHLDLLAHQQLQTLKDEELLNVVGLENEAVLAFGDICWNGFNFDREKWLANITLAEPEIIKAKAKLEEWLFKEPKLNAYALKHEIIATDDTVSYNPNSPAQKALMLKQVFPDLPGTTKPILQKYVKEHTEEERIELLQDGLDGDWSKLYLHLFETNREWLVEQGFLRPKGDIQINWNSQPVVLDLFKVLHPRVKDLSEKSRSNFPHPIATDLEKYKEALKLLTSYGDAFLRHVDMDGRIRTNFNQILTTGRVSSYQVNMQQVPYLEEAPTDELANRYRNAFIPSREGRVLVDSDFSGQELCIIAHMSGETVWLDALAKGQDLHSVCSEVIYGKKWKAAAEPGCKYYELVGGEPRKAKCKCRKHNELRVGVKRLNFGLSYGMSQFKLAADMKITVPEAEQVMQDYFTAFPSIGQMLVNLGGYGLQTGMIKTLAPFNRKRWFPEWEGLRDQLEAHMAGVKYNGRLGSIDRASRNTPVQGSAADMMKYALVLIRRFINDNNLRDKIMLVMQVHDQVTTDCDEDIAEWWKEKLTELMEKAAKLIIPSGIIKADTAITLQWQK